MANYNISQIRNVAEKPTKCIECGNENLRDNIVKASSGHPSAGIPVKEVEHAYCSSCETLMIVIG